MYLEFRAFSALDEYVNVQCSHCFFIPAHSCECVFPGRSPQVANSLLVSAVWILLRLVLCDHVCPCPSIITSLNTLIRPLILIVQSSRLFLPHTTCAEAHDGINLFINATKSDYLLNYQQEENDYSALSTNQSFCNALLMGIDESDFTQCLQLTLTQRVWPCSVWVYSDKVPGRKGLGFLSLRLTAVLPQYPGIHTHSCSCIDGQWQM